MIREKKLSRKEQIETQATMLFEKKGYVATSVRDLAYAMGIEAPSLYSHYASKGEILKNICFRMANEFLKSAKKAEERCDSIIKKLQMLIENHINVTLKDQAASAVFFKEWKHLDPDNLRALLTLRKEYEQIFQDTIKQGVLAKEFIDINEKIATLTLLSSLNWIIEGYKTSGKLSPNQMIEQLIQLLMNGLKIKPNN